MSFNGSGYLNDADFAGLSSVTNFTQIVVFNRDSGSEGAVSGGVSQGYSIYARNADFYARAHPSYAYGRVTNGGSLVDHESTYLAISSYDKTAETNTDKLYLRMNGERIDPDYYYYMNYAPNGSLGYRVGTGSNTSWGFEGDVAEVIVFDRNLTSAEFTEIETYLMEKYGIGDSKQCILPTSYTGYDVSNCDVASATEKKLAALIVK